MTRPTALDEHLIHQLPELLPRVATHHPNWRESYFFEIHHPSGTGDAIFFTLATYPARQVMDSLQMGRVGGIQLLGHHARPHDGDPHTTAMPGAKVEVVRPWEEVRLWADPATSVIGLDLVFRSRTQPYGLRRGTMRARDELIWDQSHILQSGTYSGTYTVGGTQYRVDNWVGQRDHSWGIRDHGRCPLWMWFQMQFDDGFLGLWHWELANGATIYTDGCWASADGSDPIPVVDFRYEVDWIGTDGARIGYGENGHDVVGLQGQCMVRLADGRTLTIDADGTFARPYEPHHRGGLSLMRICADDGRTGTAIYEITGARHHRFFPDTVVTGDLPA